MDLRIWLKWPEQARLAVDHRLAGNPDQAVVHARRATELAQASGRPYDEELASRVLAGLANADW